MQIRFYFVPTTSAAKKGKGTIRVDIYGSLGRDDRQRFSTGIEIKATQWDKKKGWLKQFCERYAELNDLLKKKRSQYIRAMEFCQTEQIPLSKELLQEDGELGRPVYLEDAFAKYLDHKGGGTGSAKGVYKKLKGRKISIQSLCGPTGKTNCAKLSKTIVDKPNAASSTINQRMGIVAAACNLFDYEIRWKPLPMPKQTNTAHLKWDELLKLYNHTYKKRNHRLVVDIHVFATMAGLRLQDYGFTKYDMIKVGDTPALEIFQNKNQRFKTAPLSAIALEILERYEDWGETALPLFTTDGSFLRKNLREAAKEAGLNRRIKTVHIRNGKTEIEEHFLYEKLVNHSARHTVTTRLRSSGVDPRQVTDHLGWGKGKTQDNYDHSQGEGDLKRANRKLNEG